MISSSATAPSSLIRFVAPEPEHEPPGPHALKVLVVGDDPACARFLAGALSKDGFAVRSASRGVDALNAAWEELPNLTICDLELPDMSGFDVARQLRPRPAHSPGSHPGVVRS